MSELTCYYYDEQHNRCKCYVNENLDELLAENAKLQETLQRRTEQFDGMTEMWVGRGVENAELRELVKDTHADLVRLKDAVTTFDHDPTHDECVTGMLVLGVLGAMNDRMRELGVEVDG